MPSQQRSPAHLSFYCWQADSTLDCTDCQDIELASDCNKWTTGTQTETDSRLPASICPLGSTAEPVCIGCEETFYLVSSLCEGARGVRVSRMRPWPSGMLMVGNVQEHTSAGTHAPD